MLGFIVSVWQHNECKPIDKAMKVMYHDPVPTE